MELAAFLALALLAVVRLPALMRGGASTLSELALLSGSGALSMVGTVVPLRVVDGWLGGTNVANLIQNILATLAIWFMAMTATSMATGSRVTSHRFLEPGIAVGTFTIPFFLLDRGPTDKNFIHEYAGDMWLWLYASIYMSYVVFLMVRMLLALGKRDAHPYVLIRLGAVLMGAASVAEIAYLTARILDAHPERLGATFTPLFYGGILFIAIGLAWFPLVRHTRHAALMGANVMLRRAARAHATLVDSAVRHATETTAHATYRLAVQLADIGNTVELSRTERGVLGLVTCLLNLQVPAPRVLRMSSTPEATA